MHCRHKSPLYFAILFGFNLLLPGTCLSLPFGVHDPRSLAMGGTGVAAAGSENAVFYNPAILASYKQYKEKGQNEAFSFPNLSVRVSNAVETLADQEDVDYSSEFNTAITAYNDDPTAENAQNVLNTVNSLYSTLGKVANSLFLLDVSASLVVGVPSKHQGGAFYASHRGVGDGQLSVPAADLQRLNDYQQALQLIADGNPGLAQSEYPALFDAGDLLDPSASFTAEANARVARISELGISMARQYNVLGWGVSFGLTPKMVQVTTYDYHLAINESQQDSEGTTDDKWHPNLDVGVLANITPNWRLGFVGKNLIKRDYPTSTGQDVTVKPQWRVGIAHITSSITYTVDLDVQPNDGIYPGNASQFLLAGVELKQHFLRYRLGYRDAFYHKGPKQDGIFSAGLGFYFKPVYLDLAYSENHQQRAASLMFGFNF